VQSFQEDAGLTADGVVGPETARAINAALAEAG
jgi:murein L,D-transpeptidase YcbB/YkuD